MLMVVSATRGGGSLVQVWGWRRSGSGAWSRHVRSPQWDAEAGRLDSGSGSTLW